MPVDVSGSERVAQGLGFYDRIGADYRRNRYMAGLSGADVSRRTADVLGNLHQVDDAGRATIDDQDPETPTWLAYLAEVGTEMVIRHGPKYAGWVPGLVDRSLLPASLAPSAPARYRPLRAATPLPEAYVVKYGQRRYMEEAYRAGRLRVSPASAYGDPSLNTARRDEELVAEVHFDPAPLAPFGGRYAGLPPGRHTVRHALNSNYYVYCVAARLSPRLLLDFESDAALVIREPDAFFARLDAAVRRRVPGWRPLLAQVTYYDPLQVTPHEVQVVRWKHFRYAYQYETRMAWLPPTLVPDLEPLDVDLGPLTDIAELLV